MHEISAASFFGRDPQHGMLVADTNRIAIASGHRFTYLGDHGFWGIKKTEDGSGILVADDIAFGMLVENYRVGEIDATPGKVTLTLYGDLHYATIVDFYEMLKIPPGVDTETLIKALHKEMDKRSR